jgi:glyoxylase-like metal-dependent hydrolase (beta-lactamase superfamily II)
MKLWHNVLPFLSCHLSGGVIVLKSQLLHRSLRACTIAIMLAGAGLTAVSGTAQAAAPLAKTNAPAFYRVMLGDFEVTVLNDGTVPLPVEQLLNEPADKTKKALGKYHLASPVETSFNSFLINTGSKLVLVDTGAGKLFGPTLGNMVANLKAAGYQPEQIDEIYITHMHSDHIGGLTADGNAVFPNAVVRLDQHDADFWMNQANLDKAKDDAKDFFRNAIAMLAPYQKLGHFKPFDGDTELVPGVKAVAAHGHTPGHTVYQVESKGQKLMLWGDLMHVAAVQFDDPAVTIKFDTDSKAAEAQRQKAYADAAKQGYMVGSAHLAFPALGYLRKDGKGYDWIPVNYAPLR